MAWVQNYTKLIDWGKPGDHSFGCSPALLQMFYTIFPYKIRGIPVFSCRYVIRQFLFVFPRAYGSYASWTLFFKRMEMLMVAEYSIFISVLLKIRLKYVIYIAFTEIHSAMYICKQREVVDFLEWKCFVLGWGGDPRPFERFQTRGISVMGGEG